jgi:hypothetical protein
MLNKTFRAGADPVEDGGAAQLGLVQLLVLGLAAPISNKDSSTRGVCKESSLRSFLVRKSYDSDCNCLSGGSKSE